MRKSKDSNAATPGPWILSDDGQYIIYGVDNGTSVKIAECYPAHVGDSMYIDKNAQLVCAAPAMLAALRLVRMLPGFEVDEVYGQAVIDAISLATTGQCTKRMYELLATVEVVDGKLQIVRGKTEEIPITKFEVSDYKDICICCGKSLNGAAFEITWCRACGLEASGFNSDIAKGR